MKLGKTNITSVKPWHVFFLNSILLFLWWVLLNPGFFSSDSLYVLSMARQDRISSEGTAIWAIAVKFLTLHGTQPQLATLFFSQLLAFSLSLFSLVLFRIKVAFLTSAVLCMTPIVGAMGITLWHDIPMTCGFLLFIVALHRIRNSQPYGIVIMLFALFFSSFRFNGLPLLALYLLLLILFARQRNLFPSLVVCLSLVGTNASLNTFYANKINVQSDGLIDWMRYDLSCYAAKSNDNAFFESNFGTQALVDEWKSLSACTWFNDSKAFANRSTSITSKIPKVWIELLLRKPGFVVDVHLKRHSYLVPVPLNGLPKPPFIHTTIEIKNQGVEEMNPRIYNFARNYPRAWNYFSSLFAYAGLWSLLILCLAIWERRSEIIDVAVLSVFLGISLFVIAPIADARFALFTLITGQLFLLRLLIRLMLKHSHIQRCAKKFFKNEVERT